MSLKDVPLVAGKLLMSESMLEVRDQKQCLLQEVASLTDLLLLARKQLDIEIQTNVKLFHKIHHDKKVSAQKDQEISSLTEMLIYGRKQLDSERVTKAKMMLVIQEGRKLQDSLQKEIIGLKERVIGGNGIGPIPADEKMKGEIESMMEMLLHSRKALDAERQAKTKLIYQHL